MKTTGITAGSYVVVFSPNRGSFAGDEVFRVHEIRMGALGFQSVALIEPLLQAPQSGIPDKMWVPYCLLEGLEIAAANPKPSWERSRD